MDLASRVFLGWVTDRPVCRGRRGLMLACTWLLASANAVAFGELAGTPWRMHFIPTNAQGQQVRLITILLRVPTLNIPQSAFHQRAIFCILFSLFTKHVMLISR